MWARALRLAIGAAALGGAACSVLGSSLDHFTEGGGQTACPTGQSKCGESCVDTDSDPLHCGACDNACPGGQVCDGAQCSAGCSSGKTNCSGACVTLDSDPLHCGDCDVSCNPGETCGGGKCSVSCFPPQTACGLSCVDLQSDDQHCGKCDSPCPTGQACSAGQCKVSCAADQTECGGICVNTQTNPSNCNGCGIACKPGETCNAGVCEVACPPTQTACSGLCYDLLKNKDHCGSCDTACKPTELCGNGSCALDCPPGQDACGSSCADLQKDHDNCGSCGNACTATQECDAGKCVIACKTLLNSPLNDPWGYSWDGLERATTTFANAETTCAGIGGRLPTASEMFRVSATQSASVGQSTSTNYLWSNVPYGAANQVRARLSDGATSTLAKTSSLYYRCVCPPPLPTAYVGNNCNGPSGTGCFALDGDNKKMAIDVQDRPAMPKSSAIWECAFYRGHLATPIRLAEAVQQGVGAGSNAYLHTADEARNDYDLILRWSTAASFDLSTAVTGSTTTSSRPFRCAGASYDAGTHPVAVGDEWVGPLSGYKGETKDTAASAYAAAVSNCFARGGHVPSATELGEMVGQGLPSGSGSWLWSSDEASLVIGIASLEGFKWTGGPVVPSYANGTDLTSLAKTTSQAFRCLYFPVDTSYTGPAASACSGSCQAIALGGSSGAKLWIDATDRPAATLNAAVDGCRQAGGHLARSRDYVEAVRAGLAGGSNVWLWGGDFLYYLASATGAYQLRVAIQRWTGTDAAFSDLYSTYQSASLLTGTRPYRCVWNNEIR